MVRVTVVGRNVVPVIYPEDSNTEAVKRDLVAAFGPGILRRGVEGVLTPTLTGDYDFHITDATGAGALQAADEQVYRGFSRALDERFPRRSAGAAGRWSGRENPETIPLEGYISSGSEHPVDSSLRTASERNDTNKKNNQSDK